RLCVQIVHRMAGTEPDLTWNPTTIWLYIFQGKFPWGTTETILAICIGAFLAIMIGLWVWAGSGFNKKTKSKSVESANQKLAYIKDIKTPRKTSVTESI